MICFGSGSKNGQNLDRSYELSHFTEISLFDQSYREFLVKSIPFLLFPEDLTFGKVYPRRIFVDGTAHILANFSVSGPFDRLTQLPKRTHVPPKVIPKKNIFVNDYLMLSMASTVKKEGDNTFETSIGEKKYTFKADARIEETEDQFMCSIDSNFPISSNDLKSRKDLKQFKKALLVEFLVSYGVFVYKSLISACFWFDINEELPSPSQEEKEEMANFLIEHVVKSCYIHNDDLEFDEMCHKPKKKH